MNPNPENIFKDIQPLVRQEIADYLKDYAIRNQYGLSNIPAHEHTGTDVAQVSYGNLTDRRFFVTARIGGTNAALITNYGVIFIAPYSCNIISAYEVHAVAGTDAGSVTVNIEKLKAGVALDSGTALLTSAFNLKNAANYTQTGSLTAILADKQLAKGERLALKDVGAFTSVSDVCVIIEIQY